MSEENYEYEPEHKCLHDNDDDLCHEPEHECSLESDYLEYDGQHNNSHILDDIVWQEVAGERKGYQPISQSKGVFEDPVKPPPKKP